MRNRTVTEHRQRVATSLSGDWPADAIYGWDVVSMAHLPCVVSRIPHQKVRVSCPHWFMWLCACQIISQRSGLLYRYLNIPLCNCWKGICFFSAFCLPEYLKARPGGGSVLLTQHFSCTSQAVWGELRTGRARRATIRSTRLEFILKLSGLNSR